MTIATAQAPAQPPISEAFIDRLILAICEMPDRSSPEDFPQGMVLTPEELRDYIRRTEEEFAELELPVFAQTPAQPVDDSHKRMFESAISTLAAIDEALGIGDDGCGDPDQTLDAIEELKARASLSTNATPCLACGKLSLPGGTHRHAAGMAKCYGQKAPAADPASAAPQEPVAVREPVLFGALSEFNTTMPPGGLTNIGFDNVMRALRAAISFYINVERRNK